MSKESGSKTASDKYLEFVKERLKNTDFRAEEKLKRIDELSEVVFTAKDNYQKNKIPPKKSQ